MEENKVKLFFINLSLQDNRAFLNEKVKKIQQVKKTYPDKSLGFNLCEEQIAKKRNELKALE